MTIIEVFLVKHDLCPHCVPRPGSVLPYCGSYVPELGTAAACVQCGGVGVVGEGFALRQPTDGEMFRLLISEGWDEVEKMRRVILRRLERGHAGR